jgi:hypothetical protein
MLRFQPVPIVAVMVSVSRSTSFLYTFEWLMASPACLVEDPTTKRHQPRNYLDTLEDRVALLEGLLQQTPPSIANLFTGLQSANNEDANQSTVFKPKEEDEVNDLASKVGMLGLHYAAGAEPYYLGSSSAFAFSRIINSSLRQGIAGSSQAAFGLTEEAPSLLSPCPLPNYEAGVTLSNAYFHNIHPQYPFLHEPTFRVWENNLIGIPEVMDAFNFDPVPLFFINMVSHGPNNLQMLV